MAERSWAIPSVVSLAADAIVRCVRASAFRAAGARGTRLVQRPGPLLRGGRRAAPNRRARPGPLGANRTGRPSPATTPATSLRHADRFRLRARALPGARPDDGLELVDARITNAVRCVPPQNKPDAERRSSTFRCNS